ncbi:MAG: hypothetical protein KKH72_13855 [Alphaproteobacteria bacterium]|nr:hypothetical protein [Alphaproteobacteria bacterium]
MSPCEFLEKCSFFNKYQDERSAACEGFILQYCRGSSQHECKRKAYRKERNEPPPADMLPNGVMLRA